MIGILTLTAGSALAQSDATFEFPEIEGWKKDKVIKYPQEELGSSLTY